MILAGEDLSFIQSTSPTVGNTVREERLRPILDAKIGTNIPIIMHFL